MIRIIETRYYFWIFNLIGILVFGIRNMQLMHPLFAPCISISLGSTLGIAICLNICHSCDYKGKRVALSLESSLEHYCQVHIFYYRKFHQAKTKVLERAAFLVVCLLMDELVHSVVLHGKVCYVNSLVLYQINGLLLFYRQ